MLINITTLVQQIMIMIMIMMITIIIINIIILRVETDYFCKLVLFLS